MARRRLRLMEAAIHERPDKRPVNGAALGGTAAVQQLALPVPAHLFTAAGRRTRRRLDPRSARGAVAADRQSGADF